MRKLLQPLHDTIYTLGWLRPNPNGYSTDTGKYTNLHTRFETAYVNKIGLTDADILPRMPPLGHQKGDVFQLILDYLKEGNSKVETIYKIDKRGGFANANDKEAREMVYGCITAGASMLRDLVYRAWIESALPQPPILQPLK